MALTDALGNLIDFRLLPRQAYDLRGTAALIKGLTGGQLLADRAFDANWVREALAEAGIVAVIPPSPTGGFPQTSTATPTNGGIRSRTSSESSRNTEASPCDAARQTQATPPLSPSAQPSYG